MDDWLEADYEDRQNGGISDDWDEGDDGCEIVGESFIGKDGLEYVEVRTWNYEVGEFDYEFIPTTAIPDRSDY